MTTRHYAICSLCEANCGLSVEVDGPRIASIRGHEGDPLSRGYLCPKGAALQDLHDDPDRIRRPLRRRGNSWEEIGWDEALDEAADRLHGVQERYGRDALGFYFGNPTVHSYAALLSVPVLVGLARTRAVFTANSVDGFPRLHVSALLYGHVTTVPVPDLDHTSFLLILGANPAVSNGSLMTAPGVKKRLAGIQARGGSIVVVDPRRTETAALADEHLFIRPETDVHLLAALVRCVLDGGTARPGPLSRYITGIDAIRAAVAPWTPERAAELTGIPAQRIVDLAHRFVRAPMAVAYGRMGVSVQSHGVLANWLIDVLNAVTGNLDSPGGALFPEGAADFGGLLRRIGLNGRRDRWRTRVRKLPELNGELPAVALAEEIDTPGVGQLRGLVVHAGNPVLSLPNGRRVEAALQQLDAFVAIDFYLNETTRHAHLLLPPTSPLERDHFPLAFESLSVRNVVRYAPALFEPPAGALHDWEILRGLGTRLAGRRGSAWHFGANAVSAMLDTMPPRSLLRMLLRLGPRRVSLAELETAGHVDYGPLEPRLPSLLATRDRKLHLAPRVLLDGLRALDTVVSTSARREGSTSASAGADSGTDGAFDLRLISRRELRGNNSWMHNAPRLMRGGDRCTLEMHPDDAASRGLVHGALVDLISRTGSVCVPLVVTPNIMPGVVCLPHGFGHRGDGLRLRVATAHPGASVNDLGDEHRVDALLGTAALHGLPVAVRPAH